MTTGPDAPLSPLFSIVIPTYNRADRITSVLESVRDQTFGDFECLVVDDGSVDGVELAAAVAALEDERFIYLHQENGGASKARNHGFDVACGRYIALLDSDDTFLPEKLERQASVLRATSGDVLIYSRMIIDRGLGEKVWIKPPRGLNEGERVDEYLMCTPGWIQSSTMVLPTKLARKVRFDETLPASQDTDFAIRVANAGAKVIFIEDPLVILDDIYSETRVSKNPKYEPLMDWLGRMRGMHISERSYWAYRGWQIARRVSLVNRPRAFWIYLQSAIRGVYPMRQAAVVAAQILIPQRTYQKIATAIVGLFGRTGQDKPKTAD